MIGAGLHSFCPQTGEMIVQPLGYGDSHGSYGVGQSTGSIQLRVVSSFLFSFLPNCEICFFIVLIFSRLVYTNVVKIIQYISRSVEKIAIILMKYD